MIHDFYTVVYRLSMFVLFLAHLQDATSKGLVALLALQTPSWRRHNDGLLCGRQKSFSLFGMFAPGRSNQRLLAEHLRTKTASKNCSVQGNITETTQQASCALNFQGRWTLDCARVKKTFSLFHVKSQKNLIELTVIHSIHLL